MQQNLHYTGLTDEQVLENRKKCGENILTPTEKEPLWKAFLEKFTDPIIIILLIALMLSIGVSCYEFFYGHATVNIFFEPAGILLAILLATVVGDIVILETGEETPAYAEQFTLILLHATESWG